MVKRNFKVIVIGGGHSGIEAALSCARLKLDTLLLTINVDNIGYMSCNPAIGGLAKGQLVKEIDALGGEMAKAIDATGIQFRILNKSRGIAVRSSRAQADKKQYNLYMKKTVENQLNLYLKQAKVKSLIIDKDKVKGVDTKEQGKFYSEVVILTPGTFLNGLIHIGFNSFQGGRLCEESSVGISGQLKELGFQMGRFKTGTCPRLDKRTINFDILEKQDGDEDPSGFSLSNRKIKQKQLPCYITYTNKNTHDIIKRNLNKSPLYTGVITAKGVRYCPSIEDKVKKFPERERHHIFLEPEGCDTVEIYPNGISTSLPVEVQEDLISSIRGLEEARIIRPGYGIEHDFIYPVQLKHTLESKKIENLFFAGQVNGTTGYEEAAAQGLIAGINAVNKILNKPDFIMDRTQSYIGVLIDDLVTKGVDEPYRMFTSRAEYRLLLREDNVDLRLTKMGYDIGLVSLEQMRKTEDKKQQIKDLIQSLSYKAIFPNKNINKKLKQWDTSPLKDSIKAIDLLKRPGIDYYKLDEILDDKVFVNSEVSEQVEIEVKYQGYIKRQQKQVEKFKNLEKIKIPRKFKYENIPGLSKEIIEKLTSIKPLSLGQAMRITGITPSAITILMAELKKKFSEKFN